MKKAIFGGRFNPMSVGQMDVIRNTSLLYDEVIVVVYDVDLNNQLVNKEKRAELVEKVLRDKKIDNITVVSLDENSWVDFIKKNGDHTIIRPLVNSSNITKLEERIAQQIHNIDESIDIHYIVVTQDVTGAAIRKKLRNKDLDLKDKENRNLVPKVIEKEVIKLWG